MATIKQSYLNQTYSGSYGGLSGFLKNRKKWKDQKEVGKELRKLRSFALHGDIRYKFPRRRIMINFINEVWAADLKQLSEEDAEVNKIGYLLVVVDAFSKYAWVRPIKQKTAQYMISAFKSIIRDAGRPPLTLFTDQGSEFRSDEFKRFLKEKKIKWITSYSHIKATYAERFIRTLYARLSRYMTEKQTRKYVDKLQDFVKSYNSSYHRTIGMAPVEVKPENAHEVWQRMFKKYLEEKKRPRRPPKYKVGDLVRISKSKLKFEKGEK